MLTSTIITARQRRKTDMRIKMIAACKISAITVLAFFAGYGLIAMIGDL